MGRGAAGWPEVMLRPGLLAPRLLGTREDGKRETVRVALLATTAMLLPGDDMHLRIEVAERMHLDLVDIAATVAYDGRGGTAWWTVSINVGRDATLTWWGEPLVVSDGARVRRRMDIDVAEGGLALWRDAVVLGRSGQRGGQLTCSTRALLRDEPALVEDLDLSDGPGTLRDAPGVLEGRRVIESVTSIGRPLPLPAVSVEANDGDEGEGSDGLVMDLGGAGSLARRLGTEAHSTTLLRFWREAAGSPR